MSQAIRIITGRHDRLLIVTLPGLLNGHIKLRFPEFHGISEQVPFAIEQALRWEVEQDNPNTARFEIEGLPSEIGIDLFGAVEVLGPDRINFSATVTNEQDAPIQEAFQTIFVDFASAEDFAESSGQHTYLHTSSSWLTISELQAHMDEPSPTIMLDKTYGDVAGISRLIARQDHQQDLAIGCSLPGAFAVASNHPDWPEGLLLSVGQDLLEPGQEMQITGDLLLVEGGLDAFYERYSQVIKESTTP